jgi:hypothetical protein
MKKGERQRCPTPRATSHFPSLAHCTATAPPRSHNNNSDRSPCARTEPLSGTAGSAEQKGWAADGRTAANESLGRCRELAAKQGQGSPTYLQGAGLSVPARGHLPTYRCRATVRRCQRADARPTTTTLEHGQHRPSRHSRNQRTPMAVARSIQQPKISPPGWLPPPFCSNSLSCLTPARCCMRPPHRCSTRLVVWEQGCPGTHVELDMASAVSTRLLKRRGCREVRVMLGIRAALGSQVLRSHLPGV